ncbi:MAG: hypothetical protein JO265_14505 [Acidimicrobiia bacterium]|nr:hypothetical protein [Acidimicrobiia bacterium]
MEHPFQLLTPITVAATNGSILRRAVVGGVLVGVGAAVAVGVVWSRGAPAGPKGRPASDASAAYIVEWRRSQLATWKVVLLWQRTVGSSHLEDQIRIAQRPPDRLSVAPGSIDARQGDRQLACAAGADGRLHCRDAGAAQPYGQEISAGEAVLRDQLLGPRRLYDVTASSAHCYDFRLRVNYPAPPYGRSARFCFDAVTAAPTTRDIERPQGRDLQQAVSVSAQVDDADLAPSAGTGG